MFIVRINIPCGRRGVSNMVTHEQVHVHSMQTIVCDKASVGTSQTK